MGDTLIRANELQAYTLSDEGTFWAYEGNLDLEIALREDKNLLNQYSVIPIDPDKHSHVNYDLSIKFVNWITSQEIQDKIADFEKNDHKLFIPNAELSP
jgi:tungstate transport system substrate-binding protein